MRYRGNTVLTLLLVFAAAIMMGSAAWAGAPSPTPESHGMLAKMPYPVYWQATVVYEGKLYCFGGIAQDKLTSANGDCTYTQIYDPATDKWTVGAPMTVPRRLCSAAVVNGKIHVTGGRDDIDALDAHEVYDPATNTWTTAKRTPSIVRGHSTAGVNGKLILIAGNTNAYQKWVKIYDPATDAWKSGKDMPIDRGGVAYGNAVYVPAKNRIVYVAGDKGATGASNYIGKSYAYDPTADAWDNTLSTPIKINQFSIACDTGTSKVYTFGGQYYDTDAAADMENPIPMVLDCNTWTWNDANHFPTAPPSPADRRMGGAGFINNKIYLAGGLPAGDIINLLDAYDPATDTWYQPNKPSDELRQGTQTNAVGNLIYSIGGWYDGGANGQVIVYDTVTNEWRTTNAVDPHPRMSGVSGVWNGKIVLSGGDDGTTSLAGDTVLYDPAADTFTALPPDPVSRSYGCGAIVGNVLYVFGGNDGGDPGTLAKTTALDLNSKTWATKADLPIAIEGATAQAFNGKIYIIGGFDNTAIPDNGLHDKVFIYDPVANTFTEGAEMPYATYLGASAVWGNYIIQDSGYHLYVDSETGNRYAEMGDFYQFYEPATDTWYAYPIRGWGRSYHGSAVVGNKLYSMLGASWNYLVERLDVLKMEGGTQCQVTCSANAAATGQVGVDVVFEGSGSGSGCTGNPEYTWDYGDGTQGVGTNTTHKYTAAGSYRWSFTTKIDNVPCTKYGDITISQAQVCEVTCGATVATTGTTNVDVIFVGTATATHCTGQPAYAWNYGDGSTGVGNNTTHKYATAGTFDWTLTVTVDDKSCTKTGRITITEPDRCTLTCDATVAATGKTGVDVIFFATATKSAACVGNIGYAWVYGDGATGEGNNTTHAYAAAGSYNWSVTVTVDDKTCTKSGTVVISDDARCTLVCNATVATSGQVGVDVIFFATATAENCTGQPHYAWVYGDGVTGEGNNTTHAYAAAGSYNWSVTVTVDDKTCTKNGTVVITDGNAPTFTLGNGEGKTDTVVKLPITLSKSEAKMFAAGFDIVFDTAFLSPDDIVTGTKHDYGVEIPQAIKDLGFTAPVSMPAANTVRFGLVNLTSPTALPDDVVAYIRFKVIAANGSSTVTNTCSGADADGNAIVTTCVNGTVTVKVISCEVTCTATVPATAKFKTPVTFTATAEKNNDCVGALSQQWSFGDGATSTDLVATHTYENPGTYTWTFTASADEQSCTKTGTITITTGLKVKLDWTAPAAECSTATGLGAQLIRTEQQQLYGNATFTLGSSSSGTGTVVKLPITLTEGASALFAAGFDIVFDTAFLTVDDKVTGTKHDYGVEIAQSVKDLGFTAPVSMPAANTVRFGLVNLTSPTAIPDGVVAYIRFTINATEGSTSVTNTCSGADADGNPVATICVNGTVEVAQQPVLLGYDIFRGTTQEPGEKVNTELVPAGIVTFMDENPPLGMIYYCVKAVWRNCADAPVCSNVANVRVALCEIKSCTANATPTSGFLPLAVNFTANVVTDGCTETPAYAWSFGDGGAATTQNASHTYNLPGTYEWTMIVTVQGQVCTQHGTVTVSVDPPHVTLVKKVTNPFRVRVEGTNFHQASMKVYIAGQTTPWANIKWKSATAFFIKGAGAYFPKTDTWTKIRLVNGDDGGETTVEFNRKTKAWRPVTN